ncbi:hypothetical protein V1514DRAFT_98033 [Lipomyces japonicus]|uniref:uncharacterized protein n=1 Tax=Lipomyces japonicus TaxID=56871 RepID=UPI0034CF1695
MSSTTATSVTSTSSPVSSSTSSGGGGGFSPSSSPLLLFVAVGFGVIFTNLWIIIGVKYCFRRRRNQARILAGENGTTFDEHGFGYDLAALPAPIRRRREKKVINITQLDERFPVKKYKLWRQERERAGLSSAGGVASRVQSRAPSLKLPNGGESSPEVVDTAVPELHANIPTSASAPTDSREKQPVPEPGMATTQLSEPQPSVSAVTEDSFVTAKADVEDDDEYDGLRTHPNLHPDLAETSGDSCAICIEQLEDDDNIRGLACGHAFHSSCIVPWMTTRRACCPLCKADYYIPKEPATTDDTTANATDLATAHPVFFRGSSAVYPHFYSPRRLDNSSLPTPVTQNETSSNNWLSRFPRTRLSRLMSSGSQPTENNENGSAASVSSPQPARTRQPTAYSSYYDVHPSLQGAVLL